MNAHDLLSHLLGDGAAALQVARTRTRDGNKLVARSPILDSTDRAALISQHLSGSITARGAVRLDGTGWTETRAHAIGAYFLRSRDCLRTCAALAFDIDGSDHTGGQDDFSALSVAHTAYDLMERAGLRPFLARSGGGHGFHVWSAFELEEPAGFICWVGSIIAATVAKRIPAAVLEVFPRSASGAFGSALCLPFGRHAAPGAGDLIWPDLSPRDVNTVRMVPSDALASLRVRWVAAENLRALREDAERVAANRRAHLWRQRYGDEDPRAACCRYLRKIPGATQGAHGDMATFRAAAAGGDFGLSEDEFWPLLVSWNYTCAPPWSERDLRAKLRYAGRYRKQPMGCRLRELCRG